jgi:hypothetical protein
MYITNKVIIPASEKYKQQPVHINGVLVCRSYAITPDPGFTNIVKPVSEPVTDKYTPIAKAKSKTVYPVLGAMFEQKVEVEPKRQLTTDEITVLGLKRITITNILEEYKCGCNVYQIAEYIVGMHVYKTLSKKQKGQLCDKVAELLSENHLEYYYKIPDDSCIIPKSELHIIPKSESENNAVTTIEALKSAIIASSNKTVWACVDSIAYVLGISAINYDGARSYKVAVNKSLQKHGLLVIDAGVSTSTKVNIIKVTEISDNANTCATIENIKVALIASGSKKALWFDFSNMARGLQINIDSLTNVEADKIISKYLQRNGVFIVAIGTTAAGDRAIRLGFTRPVKTKQKGDKIWEKQKLN